VFTAQLPALVEWPEFVAECAEAAVAIKSPHVVSVRQFVEGPPHSFTVVEDLRGQSLREWLAAEKPTLELACRIAFQAALGLVAIHERKTTQGKLSPEHIWIEPAGTVKLLQFPLAPVALPPERLELPLADYLAPELRNAEEPSSARADIYALGCTLFELIAGRVPFPGGTVKQKLDRHGAEIPQRLDRLVPGVPEELADLAAEMLDKEPLLRCQTASHVAHLLAPFVLDDAGKQRRRAGPPKLPGNTLTPGYGAWHAPAWQAPPQQAASARPAEPPPKKAEPEVNKPAARPAPPVQAVQATADQLFIDEQPAADSGGDTGDFEMTPPWSSGEESPLAEEPWQVPDEALVPGVRTIAKPASPGLSKGMLIAVGVGVALLAAIIVAAVLVSNQDSPATSSLPAASGDGGQKTEQAAAGQTASDAKTYAANTTTTAAPKADAHAPTVNAESSGAATGEIDDDGHTLWVAPTAGEPLALNYLPSSGQAFMVLRLADLLENSEGAKLFDALGPAGELAKSQLRATLGIELAEVEQLSIAFYPDDAGAPRAAYAIRLRKTISPSKLLEAWGQPAAAEHKGKKYFKGPTLAYYLPEEQGGRVAAIADAAAIQEIIDRDGPPLLRKGIERLLRSSDGTRHVNLLFAPSYLLTDGRSLLVGDLEKLHDPLAAFLDENIQAVLVSAYLGESLFLECRAAASVDKPAPELVGLLQARLEKVPEQVENYVASLQPNPYGRLVVNRFPRMVQLLADYTRGEVEDQQAVLRCYLPLIAAHNLLLGAELTLFEQPATAGADATNPVATSQLGARAALEKKISLSFPRETLERCLELLAKEIDVEIVILGPDLQLEGITKNQSFGLDERQQPAGEILARVLLLANASGKLVYVIKPHTGGQEAIFITTRSAAAKRGDQLPGEFAPKNAQERP
jgi:hypothetical protein